MSIIFACRGETDPNTDRLLKFEGDTGRTLGFFWVLVFGIVYIFYITISKNSNTIQHSVLQARHMMTVGAAGIGHSALGGHKMRTN